MKVLFVGVARQGLDLVSPGTSTPSRLAPWRRPPPPPPPPPPPQVAFYPPAHPLSNAVPGMLSTLTSMEDSKYYSFSAQQSGWHLVAREGLVYMIATVLDYPPSVASQALEE